MLKLLYRFLWDEAVGRAGIVWVGSVAGTFLLQPVGRPWYERLLWSALASLPGAAASLPASKPKDPP